MALHRPGRDFIGVLLMPPAALLVHQLRYLLAYGSGAGAELSRQGHAYLHSVVPWIVLCLATVGGLGLRALGRAFRDQATPRRYGISLVGLWALCTVVLVLLFAVQETLEGWFAAGHPAGWVGVFGYGGWWAVPAAAGVGLVLAGLFHGALWVLARVARYAATRRTARARRVGGVGVPRVSRRAPALRAPLVAGWSDRGPPG
jgi:hypothetical protein